MEFRTTVSIQPSSFRISHHTKFLTVGSCFANVIGRKLEESKIPVTINPFGVIFNPISIFKSLEAAIENKNTFLNSFIENNGIWYNYDLHSDLSHKDKGKLISVIDEKIKTIHSYLQSADALTITFGTAFAYRLISNNCIVANCHKIPSAYFRKELLTPHEILKGFKELNNKLQSINPKLKIILTVSPVRHIKDGLEANSVSKSILRYSSHLIQSEFPEVEYFPSYEIMMDDLRDYRFFGNDMIHPSEVAENHIWEKFLQRYAEEKTVNLIKEWENLRKALHHKPFHPEAESYQKFLNETLSKLQKLNAFMDLSKEIKALSEKLKAES
jgi:hypothetical protein